MSVAAASNSRAQSQHQVRVAQTANSILGEGPVWCAQVQALYWIDIKRPALYRYEPGNGQTAFWTLPEAIGCVALATDGLLVAALKSGLHSLNPDTGELRRLSEMSWDYDLERYNDGAVDGAGRFWIGSLVEGGKADGSLLRYDDSQSVSALDNSFRCANGMAWSPDGKRMYVTDSARRTIYCYDFETASGAIANRRVFATIPKGQGVPDGLTVDAEGYVWSAIWDGWCIHRYAASGELADRIEMPIQRPTSLAFGGKDLCTLFITSASVNVDTAGLNRGPLAGALFELEAGVTGQLENRLSADFLKI